jgi:hypothetical protein
MRTEAMAVVPQVAMARPPVPSAAYNTQRTRQKKLRIVAEAL